MSEDAALYRVRTPRPAGETLRLLQLAPVPETPADSVSAVAAGATLPAGPWQVTPGEMGSGYTWKLTSADGREVLGIIAGPLGDRPTTAAVAQAVRAVPSLIEAARAALAWFDGEPVRLDFVDHLRGALAFAGALPPTGGEARRP